MWINDIVYIIDTKWGGYEKAVAAYLVKGGDKYALIDTGYGATLSELQAHLEKNITDPKSLTYIILTHTHLDHMGSAGLLLDKYPNAKVVITEPGIINIIRPLRMYYGAKMVFGEDFKIDFGRVEPIPKNRMLLVEDGDILELDGLKLRIIETPGHTRDHISIYEETNAILFTGDAVCNKYPGFDALIPPASPPLYPVKTVNESIKKIKAAKPKQLFIPHFGLIERDIDAFIDENIRVIHEWKEYIINNLMRGHSYIDLVDMIKTKLIRESNVGWGEMPKYIKEVVLPVFVRVSVLGYMATYINRFPPET